MPAAGHVRVISLTYLMLLVNAQTIVDQIWSLCLQRESVNTTQSPSAVSTSQCVTHCMGSPQCMSGHFCQEEDGSTTCSVSSDWPPEECDNLSTNVKCTAFKRLNPCQNGGILNSDGQSCTCVNHWYDRYCHRYRYDCSEFDSPGTTVIQPKGSKQAFTMTCNGPNVVVGLRQFSLLPGELNKTFAEYQGMFVTSATSVWIGLEAMHALTQQGEYRMTVNLNWMTNKIAVYDDFRFAGADQGYSFSYATFRSDLSVYWDGFAASAITGAGSLAGEPFSTYDKDPYGCAALYGAGWWYDANCGPVLPWNAAINRGRWPSTISTIVNVPLMSFTLELVNYY